MPEVGIVLHHMPEDWTVTNVHHRLGSVLASFPESHAEAATKKHYFHLSHTPEWNVSCTACS